MHKSILFPIDLSQKSSWKDSLNVVLQHGKAFKSKIHVMTVIPDAGINMVSEFLSADLVTKVESSTKKAMQRFIKDNFPASMKVTSKVTIGNVYESILEEAKLVNADLIIMSSHRPELKDYLLGPNAARVVRHSDISVLVVRPKPRSR